MNHKLLFIGLFSLFLLTGCLAQFDVAQLQPVQDFLKDHPDATIRVNLWDEETVQANMGMIEEACQQKLPVKKYWYVNVEEGSTSIKMWVDRDSQEVVCAFKRGNEKSDREEESDEREDKELNESSSEEKNESEEEVGEEKAVVKEYTKPSEVVKKEGSYDTCMINTEGIKVTLGTDGETTSEHNFGEVPDFARIIKIVPGNKIYFGTPGIEFVTVTDEQAEFKVIGEEQTITVPANVKTLATVENLKIKFGYRVEWNGIRAFYVIKCD